MKLTGDRCQCSVCGTYFGSTYAFDRHRHGPYSDRTCMTVYQLLESGWAKDKRGFFRTPGKTNDYAG